MEGQEVTITDMMYCRDRRVQIQNEFIETYIQTLGENAFSFLLSF